MKIRIVILLFFFQLLSSLATSVETEISECPCCGKDYSRGVLMSWSAFTEEEIKAGPPKAFGQCSHCLHAWEGKPTKLTEVQKKRHFDHLGRLREVFSKKDRERLLQKRELSQHGALRHLLAYSDWVKTGEGKLETVAWDFHDPKERPTEDMKREKKEALQVLVDMKAGKKPRAEIETALKKVTMGYIEDWLRLEDQKMRTYTVAWVLWAPEDKFLDSRYCIVDLATYLIEIPKEKWPRLPEQSATEPAIFESLKYLRGDREWGEDFDEAIQGGVERGHVCWLVACAIAKGNREPLLPTLDLMKKSEAWWLLEMAPDYLQACGNLDDLKSLEKTLNLWLRRAKKPQGPEEMGVYVVGHLEEAMTVLQLRKLLEKE